MRIALFHNLPSGGAKRTLYEAARRLSSQHQIDLYTLSSANRTFANLQPHVHEVHVFDFQPRPLLRSPWGRLNQAIRMADLFRLHRVYRGMAARIETGHYDLLLAHPCRFEAAPAILRYLQTVPTIYYCHEPLRRLYEPMPPRPYEAGKTFHRQLLNRLDPLPALYHRMVKRADQLNTRRAGLILVNSKFIQEAVHRIYHRPAQVSYHGVDTQVFRPLDLPREDFLLSVGSLTPLKGFDFLIASLALIPSKERPPLVIASNFSNPPEKTYLENLAKKLNVDLRLAGSVDDEQLVRLYNQARITVYAPIREPFGLVPLEAMACGAPLIAVREGGIPESVVHNQTGLLVARDPQLFAEAIQKLLADSSLAASLGRTGRAHVLEHWTWNQAAATLESQLKSCIHPPTPD